MLLVQTIKLKSSPKQNECSKIFDDFVYWNANWSHSYFFTNSSVSSVSDTYAARQHLDGCTETDWIFSVLKKKKYKDFMALSDYLLLHAEVEDFGLVSAFVVLA